MLRESDVYEILHLETESFFLFAKIALDKIARCIEDYFGSARGLSLRSHDKWCKHASSFTNVKTLDLPDGLSDTIIKLREWISDYRDKQISHFQNPRAIFPTYISAEGSTQIGITFLNPKKSDQQEKSPEVDEVYNKLETYVRQLIELITSNRSRSRYVLRTG